MLKKLDRAEDPARPGFDIAGKKRPSMRDVGSEIAGTIIYLSLLASRMGLDLEQEVRVEWNAKSELMKWPVRL